MSTGIAIEYIAREIALEEKKPKNIVGSVRMNPPVVFCVLDTPFESIKLMIDACMKKLKVSGYDLPDTIVSLFSGLARRTIASRVKADPYAIEPIQYARNINIPCTIMIAENDDYIPVEQCLHIAEAWLVLFLAATSSFIPWSYYHLSLYDLIVVMISKCDISAGKEYPLFVSWMVDISDSVLLTWLFT